MAIYDNDGTANYEIGKLYDNDGTANHQIGKVYDRDGTANSLIYNAETVLYDGGMVVPFEDFGYVSNGTYVYTTRTDNGTNLFAKTQYNVGGDGFYEGYATWRTRQVIDLSQYGAITIKAKVSTLWSSYNGVKLEFFDANNNSVGGIDIQKDVTSTTDSEWTFDLSTFNDACKVGITAWQTYSAGRGAEFNLYKMVLT